MGIVCDNTIATKRHIVPLDTPCSRWAQLCFIIVGDDPGAYICFVETDNPRDGMGICAHPCSTTPAMAGMGQIVEWSDRRNIGPGCCVLFLVTSPSSHTYRTSPSRTIGSRLR